MNKFLVLCTATIIIAITGRAQTFQEQHKECFKLMNGVDIEDTAYFTNIYKMYDCMIGSNAPDFKVKSISGQSIELSKLKGQVIVLNFWNTGCKPCIAEMPALNEIVQKYKGKDISFISFAPEGEERIREFLKQRRFDFMAVANVDRVIKEDFLTDSIYPYTMIIDKKGKVKKILLGGVEDKEKTFKRILPSIDECLAEKG